MGHDSEGVAFGPRWDLRLSVKVHRAIIGSHARVSGEKLFSPVLGFLGGDTNFGVHTARVSAWLLNFVFSFKSAKLFRKFMISLQQTMQVNIEVLDEVILVEATSTGIECDEHTMVQWEGRLARHQGAVDVNIFAFLESKQSSCVQCVGTSSMDYQPCAEDILSIVLACIASARACREYFVPQGQNRSPFWRR